MTHARTWSTQANACPQQRPQGRRSGADSAPLATRRAGPRGTRAGIESKKEEKQVPVLATHNTFESTISHAGGDTAGR
jgi:hypothetical protein